MFIYLDIRTLMHLSRALPQWGQSPSRDNLCWPPSGACLAFQMLPISTCPVLLLGNMTRGRRNQRIGTNLGLIPWAFHLLVGVGQDGFIARTSNLPLSFPSAFPFLCIGFSCRQVAHCFFDPDNVRRHRDKEPSMPRGQTACLFSLPHLGSEK